MSKKNKKSIIQENINTANDLEIPKWYIYISLIAVFFLPFVNIKGYFSLPEKYNISLSLGEIIFIPLAFIWLFKLLSGNILDFKYHFKTWYKSSSAAISLLVLCFFSFIYNSSNTDNYDSTIYLIMVWSLRLLLVSFAILPVLQSNKWRDYFFYSLTFSVFITAISTLLFPVSSIYSGTIGLTYNGGLLKNADSLGLFFAISLPLITCWKGGQQTKMQAWKIMFATFLVPAIALTACLAGGLLIAALLGITISLISWRKNAWILLIFIFLLIFGYGSSTKGNMEKLRRHILTQEFRENNDYKNSTSIINQSLDYFEKSPALGIGPSNFIKHQAIAYNQGTIPWFSQVIAELGLFGIAILLLIFSKLFVLCTGLYDKTRCIYSAGVAGSLIAILLAGTKTDLLATGSGSMFGILIALASITEIEDRTTNV